MQQGNSKLQRGKILLAKPALQDPNFRRSVVLLTEHNEEGSVGFVLNRPVNLDISELIPELDACGFKSKIFIGGPVQQNSLHFIHRLPQLIKDSDILPGGVYWGTNFENLLGQIKKGDVDPGDIRFFLGYSGWGPKQLEEEIKIRSWILSSAIENYPFFPDTHNLWREILSSMGEKFRIISQYPDDPTLN